jgi:hypothetical protein
MRKLLRILILPFITACIVTTGVIVFYYLDAPESESAAIPTGKKPAAASEIHTAEKPTRDSQLNALHKDFVYPAGVTRDPFKQVSAPEAQQELTDKQPTIMLTGVIWDAENPIAIITDSDSNSYIVKVGEKVNRSKVLTIRPKSITIERDGKIEELILWPTKL